ncbi:transcription factor-like protein 9 [Elsinoe australis]|uniref:Transcription factor-like protein 9 n=1 Tax=Elsinoe australis TaxID=40998 RepID=A0A4U7BCD3_9PEZI|nr:transcription factor-like protein 9 [Elsinoe australis]
MDLFLAPSPCTVRDLLQIHWIVTEIPVIHTCVARVWDENKKLIHEIGSVVSSAFGAIADDSRDLAYLALKGAHWQTADDDDDDDNYVEFEWEGLDGHNALRDPWPRRGATPKQIKETQRQKYEQAKTDRLYVCPFEGCNTTPKGTPGHLLQHIDIDHGDNNHLVKTRLRHAAARESRIYACSYDGCIHPPYPTAETLQRHINHTHLNLRPYSCQFEDCNKTFFMQNHLDVHVNAVHLDIRSFSCPEPDCTSRPFARKAELQSHLERIHGIRDDGAPSAKEREARFFARNIADDNFLCTYDGCPRSQPGNGFQRSHNLEYHLGVHASGGSIPGYRDPHLDTTLKPQRRRDPGSGQLHYYCPYDGCGKHFRWERQMASHLLSHTKEKSHVCECGKSYQQKSHLNYHKKTTCELNPEATKGSKKTKRNKNDNGDLEATGSKKIKQTTLSFQ